jgi:DNA-binding response OmpR family regulator
MVYWKLFDKIGNGGAMVKYVYLSIERNIEVFERYKSLWGVCGITGIRVLSVINSINQRARKRKAPNTIIVHGDILIVANNHKAFIKDKELPLTGTEIKLLHYLMVNRGEIIAHTELFREIYGGDYNKKVSRNILYCSMKRLRNKMKQAVRHDYIETIRHTGYRLTTQTDTI